MMYKIDKDFIGGNIEVTEMTDSKAVVIRELRDSTQEWFYWAFRVTNAQGRTITFDISKDDIGKFGPSISHDLRHWEWLNSRDNTHQFTYTFKADEDCVYFAHNMLYLPDRFEDFCNKNKIEIKSLCKSKKGRDIPYIEFGSGDDYILITGRHHACEATGDFVIEGILSELVKKPIANCRVLCIPFMDFDGVVDGDQGKGRAPYDHNRDYNPNIPSIYESVAFLRELGQTHNVKYAFDFHSPWHEGGENDLVFIPLKNNKQLNNSQRFSEIFEKNTNGHPLEFFAVNNHLPDVTWNNSKAFCFSTFFSRATKNELSFSLETAYFGLENNVFTDENGIQLGKDFAKSIREFDKELKKE